MIKKVGNVLGRSEMRKIMAGSGGCICCFTSGDNCGGVGCWYKSSPNPESQCEDIYPGCTIDQASMCECHDGCHY